MNIRYPFSIPLHQFRALKSSVLVRNITKVYGGDLLSMLLGIGTTILIIRELSINDYAAYTACFTIISLVPSLVGSGVNAALVIFSAEYISIRGRKPFEIYFASLIFQMILYVTVCIILFLFADMATSLLFGQKVFDSALRFGLIAGIGVLITNSGRGIFQAEEKFTHYIRTIWLRQILLFVIIFMLFLLKRLSYVNSVYAIIVVELLVAGIITFHIFRDININNVFKSLKEQSGVVKEFIISTRWLIGYFFISSSFQKIDIFMISHFTSQEELANYGVAFRYYTLSLMVLNSIHAVLLPRFSKVDMRDLDKQRQFVTKWLKMTIWLIIPIAIIVITCKPVFLLINGLQYEGAFNIFIIFSIGIWLSLMFSPLVNILLARKAFKFLFILGTAAFVFNFLGNYFLIPVWAGLGAALITILSHALINIASVLRIYYSIK